MCPSGTGKIGIRSWNAQTSSYDCTRSPMATVLSHAPRYLVVPDGAHLGSGLEVVAVAVELEASGVGERLAGLNAEQRLVILGGVLGDVMAVVGGKWRNTELLADVEQTLSHTALDRETVIHQFEEEVVRAPRSPATSRQLREPRDRDRDEGGSGSHRTGNPWSR